MIQYAHEDEELKAVEDLMRRNNPPPRNPENAGPSARTSSDVTVPDNSFDGVNPNDLASKLAALLHVDVKTPEQRRRRRKSSEEYYDSEMGNDALAADMFDLSVVENELAAPKPKIIDHLAMDDNYRPRTSSKAKEPTLDDSYRPRTSSKAKEPTVDDSYRPRTSSKAKEPSLGPSSGGAGSSLSRDTTTDALAGSSTTNISKPRSPSPLKKTATASTSVTASMPVPAQVNALLVDDSYRPRTSSKAKEPGPSN